jgi:tetratricopeptide (TPR) repeat protein
VGPPYVLSITGPLGEGLAWSDRVLAACAGDPDRGASWVGYSVLGRSLVFRANLLVRAGRLREAGEVIDQAVALARRRGEPESLAWALPLLSHLAWLTGDLSDTTDAAAEAVRLGEETGNTLTLVLALEGQALSHLVAGQPAAAAAACERALAIGREKRGGMFAEASLLAHLALSRHVAGDQDAAQAAADEAVAVARRDDARVHECLAHLVRSKVLAASAGARDAPVAELECSMSLVAEVGVRTYEPFIREALGRLRADEGDLREAARLYKAIGATGHARRLKTEFAGAPVFSASSLGSLRPEPGTPSPRRGTGG